MTTPSQAELGGQAAPSPRAPGLSAIGVPGRTQSTEGVAAEGVAAEGVATEGVATQAVAPSRFRRFAAWAGRVNLERKPTIVLLVATVGSGTVTLAAMTGHLPLAVDPLSILLLLNLDLVLLLGLSAVIARRLVIIWAERG